MSFVSKRTLCDRYDLTWVQAEAIVRQQVAQRRVQRVTLLLCVPCIALLLVAMFVLHGRFLALGLVLLNTVALCAPRLLAFQGIHAEAARQAGPRAKGASAGLAGNAS
ncbi:hypothetical protein [Oleiagrimonas sp. C23AA]|uniref:hypothetical protein n=1 Tax=Oleiagrimonas sp. C23AA TaxID=2719047 RepID=UPI00141E5170|nr:hypothetical protein [Oleiagrimonas sp. C23AA]NII10655.1 hypothetical protein [Oleiagrimonas sp. C23AA]